MGMFDYVKCEMDLPDVDDLPTGNVFQTKSLDCRMELYTIDKLGHLSVDGEYVFFEGVLNFYTGDFGIEPNLYLWWEYNAEFYHGVCTSITKVETIE